MEHSQISAVLSAVPEPVLVVDRGNRILIANPASEELLGSGLEGQSVFGVIRQPEVVEALRTALSDSGASAREARFSQPTVSGETIYRMVAQRLPAAARLDAVVISFTDISHIEEAEQMRRDFVANVSHELRSPLTVLGGFIETLRGAARDDAVARARFLDIMEQEARRMNRLVNDLLSLSKVEATERVRPREELRLSDVIRTTLAALRPQIEDGEIALTYDQATTNDLMRGDRDQLTQVCHNLIENAIKYGGSGGRVEVTMHELDAVPGFATPVLVVEVKDWGEGIDPAHLPRLTERFYRIDAHRSREMGGTGLGLAIVKHIINRHRGRLAIRSTPGEGSVFTVFLPKGV